MLKYRGSVFGEIIEAVEVERETKHYIFGANGEKIKKRAAGTVWEDTWMGAHAYLVGYANGLVLKERYSLKRAIERYGRIESLRPDVQK